MDFSKEVPSECGLRVSIFQDLGPGIPDRGKAYVKSYRRKKACHAGNSVGIGLRLSGIGDCLDSNPGLLCAACILGTKLKLPICQMGETNSTQCICWYKG